MLRSIRLLVLGNALGQAIQFLFQPILARIYDPVQFGIFAQILAVSSVMSVIGTLQMQNAMVLPESKNEATDLYLLGILSSTILFVVAMLILWINAGVIFGLPNGEGIAVGCAFLLLSICYANLLRGWQTSRGYFNMLSLYSFLRAFSVVICQFVFGLINIEHGLVHGAIIGEVLCLIYFTATGKIPSPLGIFKVDYFRSLATSIKNYKDFALFGTVQEFVSVMTFMLPMYMFGRGYASGVGGQYAMANRLIWAPVLLFTNSTSQVVYRHLASFDLDNLNNSEFLKFGIRSLLILLAGGLASFLAPSMVKLLLGGRWELAAEMSRWIVIWGVCFMVVIPYRICFRVLRCQELQMFVDIGLFLLLVMVFVFIHPVNPLHTMIIISMLYVLENIVLGLIIYNKIKDNIIK